nr:hypothetical protein [Tanacetum cinerariifolium]
PQVSKDVPGFAQSSELVKSPRHSVKDADIAKTKRRHAAEQAEKQAEIYNLDLDHSFKVL